MYRAQEFAKLSGVTVRALHHYDRMGLLKVRRSQAGYRLYSDGDLERLEQIVALKFIGVPLKQIRGHFERKGAPLDGALRAQRRVLESKRQLLDRAIAAIHQAERAIRNGHAPETAAFKKIIEVIIMQDNQNWTDQYANDAARTKIAERRKLWSPELQERVSRQWMELIGEVEAAVEHKEVPAGAPAGELARRWKALVEEFTGGDPDITESVKNVWADRANWPAEAQKQAQPLRITPQVWSFIQQAMASQKR
jgi:DNA-binding transcriptional MerR regulator